MHCGNDADAIRMITNNDTPTPPRNARAVPPVATVPPNGTADVRRTDKPPAPPQAAVGTAGGAADETKVIRVLLLEPDRRRSDRIKERLERAEFKSDLVRAESEEECFTLWHQFEFDSLLVGFLPEGTDVDRFIAQALEHRQPVGLLFISDAAPAEALAGAVQHGGCLVVELNTEREMEDALLRATSRTTRPAVLGAESCQLTETEDRFHQIAQSLHQAFWVSQSSDGRLLALNGHFAELCGCNATNAVTCAQRFIDIVHPEDQEAVARVLDLDAARREFEFECRIQAHDGGVRWTKTRGFPIRNARGDCVRIVGIMEDTTEDRELQRKSERLSNLLAAFPDTCLLINADGSVGDVQMKDDTGLICLPVSGSAGGASLQGLLPPAPARILQEAVSGCAADGLPRSVDFSHDSRGVSRRYEARVRSAGEGRCMAFIRELAPAPQAPAAAEGTWTSLVDTLPVILFSQHRVGEWGACLFSDGCERLTGFPPGQIDGGELPVLAPLMHWEDLEPARSEVELADWEKRPYEIEYRIRTAGGGERCFREHGQALRDDNGEIIGHEGFILDITTEQQLESQLSEMVARLGTPAASLVNGLRTPESDERLHNIEAVFRGLLHHFNSALMRVRGGCDTLAVQLRGGDASVRAGETLSVVRAAAGETARMLRQLTEVILSEKTPLGAQPLDLNWIAGEAVGQAVLRHGASHPAALNIHTRLNPLPPHEGNASVILNALTALFSTMIASNTEDSRLIVESSSGREESIMDIRLENAPSEGSGQREQLHEALLQCCGIMELQGAVVDPFPGGNGLRIRLPSILADESSNTSFHHAAPQARRILIVDDEPLIVEILREYLVSDGHEVVTAATGDEALASLDTDHFDLVLTDRSMPGLSGDQLAESIHERNPALPVVMVTGMSDLMRANGEKPSHCRMVLGKPVSQASLRVALQQAVAN